MPPERTGKPLVLFRMPLPHHVTYLPMNNKHLTLLFGIPLIGILIFPFLAGQKQNTEQEKRRACAAANSQLPEINGRVALAGSGYYLLEGKKWRFLMLRCHPDAGRQGCIHASPAQKILEKNIGKATRARLCEGEIVQFEIGSQWFGR